MKITAKTVDEKTVQIEAEPDDTIGDLKKKIETADSQFPAEQLKMIYRGKILQDKSVVKDENMKEGDLIVMMVSKPKPAAAPAATADGAGTSVTAAAGAAAAAPTPTADPVPMETDAPVSMEAAQANLVSGSAAEAAVTQLCDMGFPRPEVERCLRAAFNNPDRAVEYLMNGIPEGLMQDTQPADAAPAAPAATPAGAGTAPAAAPTATGAASGGGGGGAAPFPALGAAAAGAGAGGAGAGGGDLLAQLRNTPGFAQVAAQLRQNPQLLQEMLAVWSQREPQLVQAIQQNPEAFMQAIQSAGTPNVDEQDPVAVMLASVQGAGASGAPGAGAPGGQQVVRVRLSDAEAAAVQRLQDLGGFPRDVALQAYLLCDKNEELAANYLFENMDES